jgi:hypothetical protein
MPAEYLSNLTYRGLFPATQSINAFATTSSRRLAERIEDQDAYQASKAACATCGVTTTIVYDEVLLFFWGIQAAGPNLTMHNVDRGLHAIPQRPSPNPWTPSAYFAPSNWSFIKDMMLARWDPAGVLPGQAPGCWRLVEQGRRYRPQDWATSPGDEGFDQFDAWPCHGETL